MRVPSSPLSRDASPGVPSSLPGSLAASSPSSLPMYMSSAGGGNYPPGMATSNVARPGVPSTPMYSTPGLPQLGQGGAGGYPMNQPSSGMPSGMPYSGHQTGRPNIPPGNAMSNRPVAHIPPNYGQPFQGGSMPGGQPSAYNTPRIPDASAFPGAFMPSPSNQHPPSSG